MVQITFTSLMSLLLYAFCQDAEGFRQYRQTTLGNQPGVCRYGLKTECCYGWKKNSQGRCEALCQHGCKYGECVGPNKCKCFLGFTGKTCNQDLNECGLKPRPCEHRCMNTHGSYKCYCLNGYMLMPDGSCANSRTCSMAHCQYGCEETKGEVRCLCPSTGLQLGPDGRTCVDVDECATGKALCPHNRRCVNTFGSYYCKCQIGYDLKYVDGRYDCVDMDECAGGTHKCSPHAACLNTPGSYKCKCKQGFRGSGFECSVKPFFQYSWDGDKGSADEILNAVPESTIKDVPRILGVGKDSVKKPFVHKNNGGDTDETKNVIPEPKATVHPKIRQQPFDYEDGVYIGSNTEDEKDQDKVSLEEDEDEFENQIESKEISPRGDVFIPVDYETAISPLTGLNEAPAVLPGNDEFIIDCSFYQGACEWIQETDDDFDWNVADHDNGVGFYMAVPGFVGERKEVARLRLPLINPVPKNGLCLTFNYRLIGDRIGKLRILVDGNSSPIWEQTRSRDDNWQTELITLAPEESNVKHIIFEAERGKGKAGEIGLDNVVLTSGSCQEGEAEIF
ncbi:epidermal growth factor-like protein 6 isoform X1 [Erpetoichthys calabaricus]|uniref:epidermal growth factor-like protein 6 isoform X1 n=1 Tax=Erpetoichthys calabaricus TaxID=27687 RepID=UPI0022341F66|nr:epidermal growth factor-like protein 6 isoform X1 [Erpetoichthys calabaricus]